MLHASATPVQRHLGRRKKMLPGPLARDEAKPADAKARQKARAMLSQKTKHATSKTQCKAAQLKEAFATHECGSRKQTLIQRMKISWLEPGSR